VENEEQKTKARQRRASNGVDLGSGGDDAAAVVHHFGFQLGLERLDLAEHGETPGRAAHLALELVEDLMQPFGGGPESWVVLSRGGVHVHGGSVCFLDNIIVFVDHLG
jgi:hypothetical protein